MLTAYQGQSVTLEADFSSGTTLVQVTGLMVAVAAPNGSSELAATSTGIVNPAIGVYQYTWQVPVTAVVGTHIVNWAGTYNAAPVSSTEALAVLDGSTQTWCTVADVAAITGITVTDAVVSQAGAMVDMACARPYVTFIVNVPTGQVSKVSATDQYWLKLACAYQAAWLPSQVDVMQRIDAQAVQAGRRMIQLNPGAILLSPLAQAALRRVSFLKSRSLHVPGPMDLDRPWLGAGVGDEEDSGPGWQDLGPV